MSKKLALHISFGIFVGVASGCIFLGLIAAPLGVASIAVVIFQGVAWALTTVDSLFAKWIARKASGTHTNIHLEALQERVLINIPTMMLSYEHFEEVCRIALMNFESVERSENVTVLINLDFQDSSVLKPTIDELTLLQRCQLRIDAVNESLDLGRPVFHLSIRSRSWSPSEDKFIGWERKRGKFEELIRQLATGKSTLDFYPKTPSAAIANFAYVVTIDDDAIFTGGSLIRLVDFLNQNSATIDERSGRVLAGHGIAVPHLVPRIDLEDGRRFVLEKQHSPVGNKNYLLMRYYGESTFTGKGAVNVRAYSLTTLGRMEDERYLSHDIVEGCRMRPGYCERAVLTETTPLNKKVWAARQERWIRGDLQNFVMWVVRRSPWIVGGSPVAKLVILLSALGKLLPLANYALLCLLTSEGKAFEGVLILIVQALTGQFLSANAQNRWKPWRRINLAFASVLELPVVAAFAIEALGKVVITMISGRGYMRWKPSSLQQDDPDGTRKARHAIRACFVLGYAFVVYVASGEVVFAAILGLLFAVFPLCTPRSSRTYKIGPI